MNPNDRKPSDSFRPDPKPFTLENGKEVSTTYQPGDKVFFIGDADAYSGFKPAPVHQRPYVVSHIDTTPDSDHDGRAGVHLIGVVGFLCRDFTEANIDPADLLPLSVAHENAARARKNRGVIPHAKPVKRYWWEKPIEGDDWKNDDKEDGK